MAMAMCFCLALPSSLHSVLELRSPAAGRVRVLKARARVREGGGSRRRSEKHKLRSLGNEAYRMRFRRALDAELAIETQEIRERLKGWSKQKLENEGYTLFNLSTRLDGTLFRDQILRFFYSFGDGLLPKHHQFSQGDMVKISRGDPEDGDAIEGVMLERAQRFLRVAVKKNALSSFDVDSSWRLDKSANSVSHERCTGAVDYFSSPEFRKNAKRTFVFSEAAAATRGLILEAAQLQSSVPQELHYANGLPSHVSGKQTGQFKGAYRSFLKELGADLNASQKQAIEAALCRRVTLWQGPPGTGKTKTLTQFIVTHSKTAQGRVLACADSNVAVDNLLDGLLAEGLRVVRIGQPVKVKEELRQATIEAQLAAHPIMKKVIELRKSSINQRQQSRKARSRTKLSSVASAESLWEMAQELETQAVQDILSKAQVIAATCVGAGDPVLDGQLFNTCVIDEASQVWEPLMRFYYRVWLGDFKATEPSSLIPLLRSGAERFVLVGDPAQLPPTVLSKDALEEGLDESLFEHLQECGLVALLLDTQYRMHPALASFPSKAFYDGRLLSAPLPSQRVAPSGYDWPDPAKPLAFVDCYGREEMLQNNSWKNLAEAKLVVSILEELSSGNIKGGCAAIGIITPYNAQVRLLQDILLGLEQDFTGLEIKSVDGFQGREKEVIIFSTVRSNLEGVLGFVADRRRMNVAITRARRGLIVVGNSQTLGCNLIWRQWLHDIADQNLIDSAV